MEIEERSIVKLNDGKEYLIFKKLEYQGEIIYYLTETENIKKHKIMRLKDEKHFIEITDEETIHEIELRIKKELEDIKKMIEKSLEFLQDQKE